MSLSLCTQAKLLCFSLLLLKFCEFDSFEHSLDTDFECLNFHGLDSLMFIDEVVVESGTIFSYNDASFKEFLTTIARFDEFRCDLASISTINNDSLIGDVIGKHGVRTSVEHEAILIKLSHTSRGSEHCTRLIVELGDESGGY